MMMKKYLKERQKLIIASLLLMLITEVIAPLLLTSNYLPIPKKELYDLANEMSLILFWFLLGCLLVYLIGKGNKK